jgi:hypothetical protein
MTPIVLIIIDENSRIQILQQDGVRVGFVDRRVDGGHLTVLPETNDSLELDAAIDGLKILTLAHDDEVRTAAETLRRIANREIVVVGLLKDAG